MVLSFLSEQLLQSFESSRRVSLRHYDDVFWRADEHPYNAYPIHRQLSSYRGSNLSQPLRSEWKQKRNFGKFGGIADNLLLAKALPEILDSLLAGYHADGIGAHNNSAHSASHRPNLPGK